MEHVYVNALVLFHYSIFLYPLFHKYQILHYIHMGIVCHLFYHYDKYFTIPYSFAYLSSVFGLYFWVMNVLYLSCMQVLCQIKHHECFLLVYSLPFHFFHGFCRVDDFEVLLSIFFLLHFILLMSYLRNLCLLESYKDFLIFYSRSFIV